MKFILHANTPEVAVQECATLIEDLAHKWRAVKNTVDTKTAAGRHSYQRYDGEADRMLAMANVLRNDVVVEKKERNES